ncbi:TPA: head-tail adaptor protein [Pseudomonas putida]|uniref:head-tail adaptor protein n=1 Tax=Pseudomonas putida TaxID=303 RepID=UPI000AF72F65|nr:head-tail adaptor protein [Pseudomonas putida]MDD2116507.1 head-tail adaptor protein [Pseudomonas putida]UPU93509.1 head-tail adaptor protein [Pseudomonas putida]HDS1728966.1 head-tail adaptor protein [Pseudomonas putida]
MRAGPLRHRCALQQETLVPELGGGKIKGWTPVRDIWTEIQLPTGRVDPVASQLQAVVSAEIRARFARDFKAGMRLVHKDTGETYLIEAVLASNERDMLRLLCSNVINP